MVLAICWYCSCFGGGAAAHLIHERGFGDVDLSFCVYDMPAFNEFCNGDHRTHAQAMLVCFNVQILAMHAVRTLLVQNPNTITLILELPDRHIQQVQFFLHTFNSISEAMVSSDLDCTQVVYTRCAGEEIHLSPLAMHAYASRHVTVRRQVSAPNRKRLQARLQKYASRGFGIMVDRAASGMAIETFGSSLTSGTEAAKKQNLPRLSTPPLEQAALSANGASTAGMGR